MELWVDKSATTNITETVVWPISGVLLETGNMSATIVANIVTVSMIATPEILG